MHKRVKDFILGIKQIHPEFFRDVDALDCGSLDINGNNRPFFIDSHYTGIDIVDGKNMDVVTRVHEFNPQKLFHVIISTEMLEHDEYLSQSLAKMFELLKPGGLLIITAAGFGRAEYGTVDHHPKDSPMTHNHYQNVEPEQFASSLPLHEFRVWAISQVDTDIRFYGIKKQS
ncbi:MAG: methyltransferase domain-containing protein [Bacteroidales bacterium]